MTLLRSLAAHISPNKNEDQYRDSSEKPMHPVERVGLGIHGFTSEGSAV